VFGEIISQNARAAEQGDAHGTTTGHSSGDWRAGADSGPTPAHHSFAMFDRDNQIDLEGVVQEFRFVNPHSFIYLVVKQDDGSTVTWSLEGQSPSLLAREGWTNKTLKPGDALRMRIAPLRSGAPGGTWAADQIKFRDGRPLEVSHRTVGFPESSDVTR
jgi:hypothetical protein